MHRVRLEKPRAVFVDEVPPPEYAEGQVLVEMTSYGLCAGDVAAFEGQNVAITYPLTLGHEGLGTVLEAPAQGPLPPGARVIVIPSITCGRCAACLRGKENHCPELVVMGVGDPNGLFRDVISVAPRQLLRVPDTVADDFGALIEPVAIGVHIVGRVAVEGKDVLVIGAGVTGLLSAQVARHRGAMHITVVDKYSGRREISSAMGLDDFVLNDDDDLADLLLAGRDGYDVVFDTVGTDDTTKTASTVLRPGGVMVAVAAPNPSRVLTIDYATIYRKELSVVATRNYTRHDFEEAVALLADGSVDPRPMVTGSYAMTDAEAALSTLAGQPDEHVKIMLSR